MDRGFSAIAGHKEIIAQLQGALAGGRVAHAYLFSGEPGSGKKLLATTFARALVCEKGGTDPCGECEACRKALSGTHPDIVTVVHEKPELITVSEIRGQVVNTVGLMPAAGSRRVYIINDAEKMNAQAQNALLKTIEEPPSYAVFLLLANRPEMLLPTIRSRCIRLALRTVSDEEVRSYLLREEGVGEEEAEVAAAMARGSIGRAKEAAGDTAFKDQTARVIRLVRALPGMNVYGIDAEIRDLAGRKEEVYEFLSLLLLYFRDVLLYKAAQDPDMLIFKKELSTIRAHASAASYEGLEEIIDAVQKAEIRLRANVGFDLVFELLFLTIRDNLEQAQRFL